MQTSLPAFVPECFTVAAVLAGQVFKALWRRRRRKRWKIMQTRSLQKIKRGYKQKAVIRFSYTRSPGLVLFLHLLSDIQYAVKGITISDKTKAAILILSIYIFLCCIFLCFCVDKYPILYVYIIVFIHFIINMLCQRKRQRLPSVRPRSRQTIQRIILCFSIFFCTNYSERGI